MSLRSLVGPAVCTVALAASGCGSKQKTDVGGGPTTGMGQSMSGEAPEDLKVPKIDPTLCQASDSGRVATYDLNHDDRPDEWKIYRSAEQNGVKTEILTCKQVDLDHDAAGRKDYVVEYDESGNILLEEVDYDYDGKFDARRHYDRGTKKLIMVERNAMGFDDKPDLWEEYSPTEKLDRVLRDRNGDTRPDYWELYSAEGTLEAILYDDDFDGKVDKREDAVVTPPAAPAATTPAATETAPAATTPAEPPAASDAMADQPAPEPAKPAEEAPAKKKKKQK